MNVSTAWMTEEEGHFDAADLLLGTIPNRVGS